MMSSVERWLQTILCSQYAHLFEAFGYRSLHSVCFLQLPHLLAMGVPRDHCEKILENLRNLRQTMFGHVPKASDRDFHFYNKYNPSVNPAACALKTVAMNANYRGMNQYSEEYSGYGQPGNNMQAMGFHQASYENSNMGMMNPMSSGGTGGYSMPGYDAGQSHMMMAGQGQMPGHPAMYQQHTQQTFMAQQQQQQQYYTSNSSNNSGGGGGNSGGQYTGQPYPVQGSSGMAAMGGSSPYYNTGSSQGQGTGGPKMVPPPHHHLRNTSGQQNPQQVADNILQMASSFPSHHTVQVPLKNRHAPYQIPRSPQNYYPEKGSGQQQGMGGQGTQQAMLNPQGMVTPQGMTCGQMQSKTSQPQGQMGQASGLNHSPVTMYAGSSPHSQIQQNSSPTSPMMMPSPIAAHQAQGLSSPGALHSPSSTAVCSPVPSSPGMANMRSPNSMPMRSPAHLPSGYSCQPMSSPPQRPFGAAESSAGAQHCSPTSMHSPASHSSSPYAQAGMSHHVNSPPGSQGYSAPASSPYKMNMLMDSGQGPGAPRTQGTHGQSSDPLQSLQKLVMLPETQVVDPKSVVSDGCLQNSEDGSKNSEGPAEQSREAVDCSAGVSVISSSPPTTADAPSVTNSSSGEKSAEPVNPAHTKDDSSGSVDASSDKDDGDKVHSAPLSSAAVSEDSCITPLSRSQPHLSPTNHNIADQSPLASTSSVDCSSTKQDVLNCSTDVSHDMQTETAFEACQSEITKTEKSDSSEPVSDSKSGEEKVTSPVSEIRDCSYPVHSNDPVSELKTEAKDQNLTMNCSDQMPSSSPCSSAAPLVCGEDKMAVAIVRSDSCVKSQDSDLNCESAASKETATAKPSPPKKRLSQRLIASSTKSDNGVSSWADKGSPVKEDFEGKITPDNVEVLPVETPKPSPPKKRHSQRISNAANLKSFTKPKRDEIKTDDGTCSKADVGVSSDADGKETLVNGFVNKHVSSLDSAAITVKEKINHKNHVKQGNKEPKSKISEETSESSLMTRSKHRQLIPARVACMVGTVNETANVGLITSGDVIDFAESDSEEVEQNGPGLASSSSKMPSSGVSSADCFNGHPMSDDDSYTNELDFGYDSPPCEMQGSDDNWKPDLGKQRGTNGVDEADGNFDGAEKDPDDKGSNNTSQTPTESSPDKATASVRTRSVTRSVTGRAPKRKANTDMSSNVKRTRRSSGVADQQYAISLSMECDEIDTKEDFSDVEVISSSDDSSVKNKSTGKKSTENNAKVSLTASQANHKKSPVVMLNNSSSNRIRKDKRALPVRTELNKTPFRNFYSVRGVGGRFISRQQATMSSSSKEVSASFLMSSSDTSTQATQKREGSTESVVSVEAAREMKKSPQAFSVSLPSDKSGGAPCAKQNTISPHSTVSGKSNSTIHPNSDILNKVSDKHTGNMPGKMGDLKKSEMRPVTNNKKKKSAKKKKTKNETFRTVDSVDDSFKNMKFSRTLNHLQRNKKGDKSHSGLFSPFIRVQGKQSTPSSVSVFNLPPADTKESKSSSKTKSAANLSAPTTTIQITNFSSDKSVMLPSVKTTDSSWVCALCGKRSSFRFLGDLFGPYYLESQLPSLTKYAGDGGKKDSKPTTVGSPEVQNPHNTRRKSLSVHQTSSLEETVTIPREVWVHEDCVMWSSGVYMVGSRIYGLEEALKATTATMCACCQEKGALIGCLHKGCNQNFHYICAVDKMCFLDVENFSMLCPKHKDKRMKSASASTSKS